jgi:hypothetical protein
MPAVISSKVLVNALIVHVKFYTLTRPGSRLTRQLRSEANYSKLVSNDLGEA